MPEKAPEQLQETEHQQLAAAEKRRLKRMRSAEHDDDSADDVADAPAPAGGFAARRHKQKQAEAAVGSKAGPSGEQQPAVQPMLACYAATDAYSM